MNTTITNREFENVADRASLQAAIAAMSRRVHDREAILKENLPRLPKEGFRKLASTVVPAFLTTTAATSGLSAVWNIGKLATGSKHAVLPLIRAVAKTGLFGFLRNKAKALKSTN